MPSSPASHRRNRIGLVLVAAAVAALCAVPTATAVPPAIDEYTLRLPDAGGKGHVGPETPIARPDELPPEVRSKLGSTPEGELLAQISTARQLGAPEPRKDRGGRSSDVDEGLGSAVLGAVRRPGALALLAALVAVGAVAIAVRRRGSNAS